MGVDLGPLMVKHTISLDQLVGKRVAIDAYNALYQFLATIRQPDGTLLMDTHGRVTSHVSGLFYRSIRLLEKGIRPVYVFDGVPPEEKRRTLEARAAAKEEAAQKWSEALKMGDLARAKTYAQATVRLTPEMVEESKELLRALGIPFIQAPQEGEAQAAFMAQRGDVWACASEDYDALLFGTPRLIRHLTLSGKRKVPGRSEYIDIEPELIELSELLRVHELSREKLVWLAVLCGTDYNPGIKGIGPKRALLLVQKFENFDTLLRELRAPSWFHDVVSLFLTPATTTDYTITFHKPDEERLMRFLGDREFSHERVSNALAKIRDTGVQTTLDSWFSS